MPSDLTDDDKAVLIELLRDTIERDRFPTSPKVKRLKAVLAKLVPPAPRPEPMPAPKPPGERSMALGEEAAAVGWTRILPRRGCSLCWEAETKVEVVL